MLKVALITVLSVIFLVASDDCPTIKSKRQWQGKRPKELTYQILPIRWVVIHHTVTDECNTFLKCAEMVQNIQNYHMNELGFNDIGLNFLIGNDGIVYEGTGWAVRGSHTYGFNQNGTGIAFIGNFDDKLPSNAALTAAKKLLACGVERGDLSRDYRLIAGSQAISTQSPGRTLYSEITEWNHWTDTID